MATATATTQLDNPRKTPDKQQQPSSDPGTDPTPNYDNESKNVGNSPANGVAAKNNENDDAPVSSTQKKIRRAERFGMPVQLTEEEKRNSRAERFGTASSMHGSDALKKSEEQKRKARAERFGLVQSVPSDEEAKKKARLDRFAAVPKTDPQEEDKKKARAIRFSQTPSGSLSQVNGKGDDIETKTAIAGKAGGGT